MKPASSSLFLKQLGADKLPYVTILIAGLLGFFVAGYIRISRKVKLPWMLGGTLIGCILSALGFWMLLGRQVVWVYPVFSIWVGMYGVIATTQVWTLANELFTTREAKHVFGVVGAGGISGGILGSYATRALAPVLGTINLLLVAAGLLTVALVIALVLMRYRLPSQTRQDDSGEEGRLLDSLRYVTSSSHLRLIAGLVLVTAIATKIVDWQFQAVAVGHFADGDQLSAFFGSFYGTAGILGLIVQLFLTSRILRRFGLGGAILIFPLSLVIGTVALIPVFGLFTAVMARGSDAIFKHSLDRSTRELAYLPVPRHRKSQAKSAIDMVVDRTGDGIAGFVQLGLIFAVASFGGDDKMTVQAMAWFNLVFLALWLWMARRLRRSYIQELTRSIARGRVEVNTWHEALAGADTLEAVRRALTDKDPGTVLGALDVLAENPQWNLSDTVGSLVTSDNTEIRARALALLLSPGNPDLPEGVTTAFADEDRELLRECLDLQLSEDPVERHQRAEQILDRAGGEARGAWIALMVRRLGPEFAGLTRNLIEELLRPESSTATRQVAATAIGMLPRDSDMHTLLPSLLSDTEAPVAAAAARSAAAVGRADLLQHVIPLIGRRGTRRAARLALQKSGEAALPAIRQALNDPASVVKFGRRLPPIIAGIPSHEAFELLVELLDHESVPVAESAILSLYHLRVQHPDRGEVPESTLLRQLSLQTSALDRVSARRRQLAGETDTDHAPSSMLRTSLERVERKRMQLLFQLLALRLPPRRIQDCRHGLLQGDIETRANALELLEATLSRTFWLQVEPVLSRQEGSFVGAEPEPQPQQVEQALMDLSRGEDPWIAACSLYWLLDRGSGKNSPLLDSFRTHPAPMVRELAVETAEESREHMTVVEKVALLKEVDPFRDVPPDQLAVIAALARPTDVAASHEFYRQGDPAGDLFVLLEGSVSVERNGRTLGTLGAGDALGTWALLEDEPRLMKAQAQIDCRLLRINRSDFDEALEEHPEIARTLIRSLLRKVRSLADAQEAQ
jgi:hypothetical protein